MTNYRATSFILTLISTGFLISCDPGVRYDKIVENNSDHDLTIYIYPDSSNRYSYIYDSASLSIPRHSETSIAKTTRLGQTREFKDCNTYADSIKSKVDDNDSLKVTINIGDKANWKFTILKKAWGDGGTCECRLKITNADIH